MKNTNCSICAFCKHRNPLESVDNPFWCTYDEQTAQYDFLDGKTPVVYACANFKKGENQK